MIINQTALKANALSVIPAHNHPSGNGKPGDGKCETGDMRTTNDIFESRWDDMFVVN